MDVLEEYDDGLEKKYVDRKKKKEILKYNGVNQTENDDEEKDSGINKVLFSLSYEES